MNEKSLIEGFLFLVVDLSDHKLQYLLFNLGT